MDNTHLIKDSNSYWLLRKYTVFWYSLFYSELTVINKENVPVNEPVIFSPNHQNALMDALAIICTLKIQPVFMARADIFKKKTLQKILHFLKIIPVYRIRDGFEQLSNNDQSFNLAFEILQNKKCVGIMPEGNHGNQRRLRPLKKGLSRFALHVQEKLEKGTSLKIVPVGIEYSNYIKFRSRILVIYGKPIEVSDFMDIYINNKQKAISLLRDRLAEEMKLYMTNIDSDDSYDLIYSLTDIYSGTLKTKLEAGSGFYEDFQVKKIISDKLVTIAKTDHESLEFLRPVVNEFNSVLKSLRLVKDVFDLNPYNRNVLYFDIIRYSLFLPFALVGIFFHILPAIFIKFISGKVKDTQFQSSVKFVMCMILFPVYYIIILIMPVPVYSKILVLLVMPVLGVLSFDYFTEMKSNLYLRRFYKLKQSGSMELSRLIELRGKIIKMMDVIV